MLRKIAAIVDIILWLIIDSGILFIVYESIDAFINGDYAGFANPVQVFGFEAVFQRVTFYLFCFFPVIVLYIGIVILAVLMTIALFMVYVINNKTKNGAILMSGAGKH